MKVYIVSEFTYVVNLLFYSFQPASCVHMLMSLVGSMLMLNPLKRLRTTKVSYCTHVVLFCLTHCARMFECCNLMCGDIFYLFIV
jgi:hypothetical protein